MVVNVTPERAWELISSQQVQVIDVRDASEFGQGHVPGARLLPLAQLRANPSQATAAPAVLFVCAGGVRSQTAARIAMQNGAPTAFSVIGGVSSWTKAGLPLESALPMAV